MKIVLPIFCGIFIINQTFAGSFFTNSAKECYADTSGINSFWFCGAQSESCSGKKARKYNRKHWYYHGEYFEHDGIKYWCCNGSGSGSGTFVESSAWSYQAIRTKELTNGTCNYIVTINICGQVTGTPCTKPDKCNENTVLRNEECIFVCEGTSAFESYQSNTCVDCPTTNYQGINEDFVCTKCDPELYFFNKKTKKCEPKENFTQYPKSALKKCFMCPDNVYFEQCVFYVSGKQIEDAEKIKIECKLSDE